MKFLKHLFTALLLLCATAVAAHDFEVDGIFYNITDATNKTVAVTYKGDSYSTYSNEYTGSVVIPESVTYNGTTYSVTSIGKSVFHGCSGLTGELVIPNSVTSIGDYAFGFCPGLTSVIIGNSVTSIGRSAFAACTGLTSIKIPNCVTSIGNYAFSECYGLTSIVVDENNTKYDSRENCNAIIETGTNTLILGCKNTIIPDSVTSIEYGAFYGCTGLTSVEIPNSVTSIGDYAFRGCSGLTSVVIGNSVTSIGDYAFRGCSGLTSIVIGNSVTSIGYAAFDGCTSLKELCIADGEGTLSLGYNGNYEGLFYDCPLETLYLGRDLSYNTSYSYGYSPFYNNKTLKSVTIGNSVTSIGSYAFDGCTGLTSVVIPNSVASIGSSAFYGCFELKTVINFSNLTFSKGSTVNGYVAYYANNVCNVSNGSIVGDFVFDKSNEVNTLVGYLGNATELILPADYNSENYAIGNDVFRENTALTSIEIPNSVTSIGEGAFAYCSGLTSVVIPNSVTSIGNYAFYNCENIVSAEIPNSVTSIGGYAFKGCTGLTSIEIPYSVTSIKYEAFYGCTILKTVINFSNLTFSKGSTDNGYVAYYADNVYNAPKGSKEGDYIFGKPNDANTLVGYLGNETKLTLPADYSGENYVIGADAFKGNTTIKSVEIPNSVTSIGSSAFYGCSGLTNIEIPNSVTSIGQDAFCRCNNLTSVELPSSLTAIELGAFSRTGLIEVTIPEGVTSLGKWAFDNCPALVKVNLPKTLTSIGDNAFENCTTLANIIIPDSVTSIGSSAFSGCSGLTSIEIPNSVTSIGTSAFKKCSNIENLYISNSLESVGEKAFADCKNIKVIKVGLERPIRGAANIFADAVYDNAVLYVPTGTKSLYEKREPWNLFFDITEMDFTGIENVKTEPTVDASQSENWKGTYYDLNGRVVENPTKGIYILNGKKVLVK